MRDDIFRRKEREKQAANAAAAANVHNTNNAGAANNIRQRVRSPERKKCY